MASSDEQDHVSAFVPSQMKAALEESARAHDRSVSGELRQALELYLAEPGTSGPSGALAPRAGGSQPEGQEAS